MRARAALLAVVLVLRAGPALADPLPRSMRLEYTRGPRAAGCPDEQAFRDVTESRMSYLPFSPEASARLVVTLTRKGQQFQGRVELRDGDEILLWERDMGPFSSCDDVLLGLGVSTAIHLDLIAGIAGLLLGGAITGAAATRAYDHRSSLAPEEAIRAELPPPLSTGVVVSVPPSLGSVSLPVVSNPPIRAPAASSATPTSSTLRAELYILEKARSAAKQGHFEETLEHLNRHAQQFPLGVLTSDREKLRRAIEARRNAPKP